MPSTGSNAEMSAGQCSPRDGTALTHVPGIASAEVRVESKLGDLHLSRWQLVIYMYAIATVQR